MTADFAGLDIAIFSRNRVQLPPAAPRAPSWSTTSCWRMDLMLVGAWRNPTDAINPPKGIIANPN